MEAANTVFYFITDKIVELQVFFLNVANTVARIVLLVAVLTAAVNYALTGTGLKENVVKIGKALVFFSVVLFFYPRIVSWITDVTFSLASQSIYEGRLKGEIQSKIAEMEDTALETRFSNLNWTASAFILTEPKYTESNSHNVLKGIINIHSVTINGKSYAYSTVAPAAALDSVFLIASEIFAFSKKFDYKRPFAIFGAIICAFFTILVGCFCVLEYLMAFVEFMFVSSVGVILFPMSLWEGTKFIAESYIKSMLGFFVKLLFSAICIFLMLYVFVSLASQYTKAPFIGEVEQIVPLFFASLLVFYICKSAPALAQGLLSGSPSLTGAGAIGTVASAVTAAARLTGMAGGQGAGSPRIPSSQTASITGGTGVASAAPVVASVTPPPFYAPQASAALAPPPSPQRAAIDYRGDLTRSLTYSGRPTVEGGSGGAVAMLPEPGPYQPNAAARQAPPSGGYGGKEKAGNRDVTYEVLV
jgi:hypothetical protein